MGRTEELRGFGKVITFTLHFELKIVRGFSINAHLIDHAGKKIK